MWKNIRKFDTPKVCVRGVIRSHTKGATRSRKKGGSKLSTEGSEEGGGSAKALAVGLQKTRTCLFFDRKIVNMRLNRRELFWKFFRDLGCAVRDHTSFQQFTSGFFVDGESSLSVFCLSIKAVSCLTKRKLPNCFSFRSFHLYTNSGHTA